LISFAAPAERCASDRTSEATTAKPLPASPARAASIPAFKASRLVWKAISSITPMMWVISVDDLAISRIAATALPAMSLPRSAPFFASDALALACWAPSADLPMVAVISFTAAAVSSKLAA